MAIRNPTTLAVDFNSDLKTENAYGRITTNRIIASNMQLPFGSYTIGSVDLTNVDSPMVLGNLGAGVILSSDLIDVTTSQSIPVTTKLFAYDGAETTISISTDSTDPITVEYAIGIKLPAVSDAPTSVVAVVGDARATVSFAEPYYDGGNPITGFLVKSIPGNITATGTESPIVITGLTNGIPYTFTVSAINAGGNSPASLPSNSITPFRPNTIPGAPSINTVTGGNAQASIEFTPPMDNGGAVITQYTVTSNPGNIMATGTASPIVVSGLTNGTPYTFTITATNSVGVSSVSTASASITPITIPTAPSITNVALNNNTATITYTVPANTGGSAIANYIVTSNPGNITITDSSSPTMISGLTYGTVYTFTVSAVNAAGSSPSSIPSNSVTPITIADAPIIGTAVMATPTSATVGFNPPVNDGGSTITSYVATSNPGNITASGLTSPITVTGLTTGTAYTFTIAAVNLAGTSNSSAVSNSITPVIPITVADAPTIGTATVGNTQATVEFIPPVNDGGSAITGYTVTSNPGNITATGTASPITVTGLTNGTAYTFTVTATNSVGVSAASAASNSITPVIPITVAGAPTIGTATVGNAEVTVEFTPPTNNGGSAITSYTVTSNPGNITAVGTSSPIIVTGLTNGTAYTFTVTATNAIGISTASAASSSITPIVPITVAAAPTIGNVVAGNTEVTVEFTPPTNNGGSTITGYTVTSNPGNITATGTVSPITVTGLTNGTAYTFTVTATNSVGVSAASTASSSIAPIAPATIADAPTVGNIVVGNAQATVEFTPPTNNGGSAITGYTITSNPGNITATGTASPITVTGLTNGTAYTFTVTATNSVGVSAASLPSGGVTPVTIADAPSIITTINGDAEVTVEFTPPANDGGSAITSYTVTSNPDNITATGIASPITVTGLTNGTAYTFTVTATNSVGTSLDSLVSASTTPGV
jgi:hypothetical protein